MTWLVVAGPALAATPAAEPPAPAHPLVKPCDTPVSARCAAELEAQALRSHPVLAQRDGVTLALTPPQGEPQTFVNTADASLSYHYLGPLAGTDLQLLLMQATGTAPRYVLVDAGTGTRLAVEAPPWPAPGGRLMVVTAAAHGGQAGSVSLFNRVNTQWRLLFRFEPAAGMGFQFRSWRQDAASLRLDWVCEGGPSHSGSLQLRDGPYGWDLVPAAPARCP
jgi:hypothetical protein